MNKFYLTLVCATTLTLAACSGDSSDSGDNTVADIVPADTVTAEPGDTATATEQTAAEQTATVLTGRFVDSSVGGLSYETATQSGVTDANGTFNYVENELVTFSIGDIDLPAVAGAELVTPLDVFSATNIDDPRVLNLARLLQTLDVDANPENGIELSGDAAASATGLAVDFASDQFDSQVVNLVANSGSSNTTLIDAQTAMDHFMETLFAEGLAQRPETPVAAETDTEAAQPVDTSGNTSTHPLVGRSAEFRNFFHDIGGTVTVLDDRTLEVTNFTYDGGGPSVYFYTGNNGDYSPRGGGQLIGPQLNGRPWTGDETITITLPANVTLDDFDGISVWCDIFFANFGDAIF